jgi:4-diphosphocytidyl-2-C-methyl-D-erythritol kinase
MTPLRVVAAHAKINLALHILAREASGYHQIETVLCRIALADELEIDDDCAAGIHLEVVTPHGEHRLATSHDVPPAANLAFRAAALFFETAALAPRVRIRLTKRIPACAGLGGGSSDAAAVLAALNGMHGTPLGERQLLEAGATLGSDVPFFIAAADLALAWGRGTRIAPLPALPPRPLLLAVPPVGMSTATAYAEFAASRDPAATAPPRIVRPLHGWDDVAAIAHNDFEATVFQRLPELRGIRDAIAASGAAIARITGSGSAIFGVYEDVHGMERARQALAERYGQCRWIATST